MPSDAQERFAEASTHALEGRLQAAEEAYHAALAVDPGLIEAQVGLALCLSKRGAVDEARSLLSTLPATAEARQRVNGLIARLVPRESVRSYWSNPPDAENKPQEYAAAAPARSVYLTDLIRRVLPRDGHVLEIGCNAGRNLAVLHLYGGYQALSGVELNRNALDIFRESFPRTHACAQVHCGPAEEIVRGFTDGAVDLVFSMAVLEHIHPESESLFADMVRISRRFLLTIEDEEHVTGRHFVRDYGEVFGKLGLTTLLAERTPEGLGLGNGFVTRLFSKP